MRTLTTILVLAFGPLAYANCPPSFEGVSQSNSPEIPTFVQCANCRSAQDHLEDFLARASNYVFHTNQGQTALGTYAGGASGAPLTFPVCSTGHGQCVTAEVTIDFEAIDLPVLDFSVPSIQNHTIRVTTGGGQSLARTSVGPDANPVYLIPTDNEADTIPDGECVQNNGQSNEESTPNTDDSPDDSGSDSGSDSGGGSGGGSDEDESGDFWGGMGDGYGELQPCWHDPDPYDGGVVCYTGG